jgi:hypothetical protein
MYFLNSEKGDFKVVPNRIPNTEFLFHSALPYNSSVKVTIKINSLQAENRRCGGRVYA